LNYIAGVGHVHASNTVVVRSLVEGQILQLKFAEGQAVHKGDVLAQIDPRPFQAKLDFAVANRDRDRAQLEIATERLHRDLPMLSDGFVARDSIDDEKAEVAEDTAAVQSDLAAVKEAQLELSNTSLTAPIDGVTGIRKIDVGNIIRPTDTQGLVVITQLQPVSVIFTLPERDLPQVQRQMATGPVKVLTYDLFNGFRPVQGILTLVDNEIIQESGSARFKAVIPNPLNSLWPGEFVKVRVLLNSTDNGLVSALPEAKQESQLCSRSTHAESSPSQRVSDRG
jgi:membrane fusion protein, multidrug efflux system